MSRAVFTIKEPRRNGRKVKNVFHLDFTVHSVGAEGPHSISLSYERWAVDPHLLLSDSSKARTLFHRSLSGLPAAHTFFWVIPTTPAPKWRWFHRVRCGDSKPHEMQIAQHPFESKTVYKKQRTSTHVILISQLLDLSLFVWLDAVTTLLTRSKEILVY